MPSLLDELVITRVDLVNEGANSAAFIELYKRKEPTIMEFNDVIKQLKPEHAAVITAEVNKAKQAATDALAAKDTAETTLAGTKKDLTAAQKEAEDAKKEAETAKSKAGGFCSCTSPADGKVPADGICKTCGKPIKPVAKSKEGEISEEVLKAMPEETRQLVIKLRDDVKANADKVEQLEKTKHDSEAIAKAATLKALPIEEKDLLAIVKKSDDQMLGVLTSLAKAFEDNALTAVGKSVYGESGNSDAYTQLEAKATEIKKSRPELSQASAFTQAMQENPELYKQYVQGGAK
jgi:hypothetical protein